MAIPGGAGRIDRRSLFGLGGGLALAAGLAACGSNTGRPSADTSSPGVKPTLSQWYHEYGEDGVQEAVKRYAAAYPDATVTVKWNPGDYEKAVSAALLTSTVPDVFEYGNGPTLDMINAGQVVDLTDLIGSAAGDYIPAVIKPMTWRDRIYAIPQTVDMQLIYYRKDLLEAKGITPPATFDELVAAAKAVATKDIGGFFAGNDGGIGVLGAPLIWASGLEYLNAEQTGVGYADPALYAALKSYADFSDSGALLQSASADWFSPDPFLNGEAAMVWSGLWNLPQIEAGLSGKYGVLPFPAIGSGGRPAVPTGAYGATVAAKGPNTEAAKAFVKWLWVDQDTYQLDFSQTYGFHIPAKTALSGQADQLKTGAGADAAKFVTDYGHGPDLLYSPATQQAFSAAFSNVVKKGADPKDEIAAVAAKASAEIKRLNG